ncbi:MAG: LicD family protein [Bacteroidaceae bacterium]|nr:LicD family protein [Bacteroidaceae bacterium]
MNFDPILLREKYNPEGSQLWKMQQRMLSVLAEIDKICQRHQIPYWLSGGSMLGAVRHQGFIPWDDDLDIEMLRPDFLRLMKVLETELPDNLALQWHTTDPNYFFQFAKIRDKNSELYERNGYDKVWKEHGIFIDIFPLERVPRWIHNLSNHTFGHTYKMMRTAENPFAVMWKVRTLAKLNRNLIFPVLRGLSKIFTTRYYDFALGIPYYQHSLKEDYLPVRYVKYEDTVAPIMKEAEKCLLWRYGDYMQLPKNPGSEYHAEDVKIW